LHLHDIPPPGFDNVQPLRLNCKLLPINLTCKAKP
jgi:hypothetical protein